MKFGGGVTRTHEVRRRGIYSHKKTVHLIKLSLNPDAYLPIVTNTHPEALEYLLKNHYLHVDTRFSNGSPLLCYAAINPWFGFELAEILIKKGADVTAAASTSANHNWTVLHFIVPNQHASQAELAKKAALFSLLLEAGADLNAKDAYQRTALKICENAEFRAWLIAHGAKE